MMPPRSSRLRRPGWNTLFGLALALFLALLAVSGRTRSGLAQSGEQVWSEPINLSHSGGTDFPRIFFDSENTGHVVWLDIFEGIMYTQIEAGETAADPAPVAFPFAQSINSVRFLPDRSGNVHVLWRNEEDTGDLMYARVSGEGFADPDAWSDSESLGQRITVFDAELDETDRLHVLYQQSDPLNDIPAGIYYRYQESTGGDLFSSPVALDTSRYFRGVETLNSTLSLALENGSRLHAAWEIPALDQVFYSRSVDGGSTWEPPGMFDARTEQDSFDARGPSDVQLAVAGDAVFRFWQAGHEGEICSQYVQISLDGGATWADRESLSQEISGCPSNRIVLKSPNGDLILMTVRQAGVFLRTWESGHWSDLQLQSSLSSFVNPDTFRQVSLTCRQAVFDRVGTLYVIGCDRDGGEDVWLLSRSLNSLSEWFPTPTPTAPWSSPNAFAVSQSGITNPTLVSDSTGRLHAFWTREDGNAVKYARWEGDARGVGLAWSTPIDAVSVAGSQAEAPSAVISPNGRMYLVWAQGGVSGIGFTSANPDVAIFPDDWPDPVSLPVPRSGASSPVIALDAFDTIYVAYAIPINEHRGIYLVNSQDRGRSWSDPVPVIDAQKAGWDMVDQPTLTITGDGKIHVLYTRYDVDSSEGTVPIAMLYQVSDDGGQTWGTEQVVTTRPVYGGQMLGIGGNSLQRVWIDQTAERLSLWYQVSHDSGANWSEARRVSEFGLETPHFSLTLDQAGAAHIVQVRSEVISDTGVSSVVLQHSAWDGFNWRLVENFEIGEVEVSGIASAIGARGNLGVLYVFSEDPAETGSSAYNLMFTNRYLDLNVSIPTPVPTSTPAPGQFLLLTPSPQPTLTPTITFSRQTREPGLLEPLGTFGGLIVGIVPVVLLVAVVFVIGRRRQVER